MTATSTGGPYSTEQMIQMPWAKQVDRGWNVWREGMEKWTPAARLFTIPELSDDGHPMRLKRLESATRRFLAATKALAVTRRLAGGLKIEINHAQGTHGPGDGRGGASDVPHDCVPAGHAGSADAGAVRDRLRDLFESGGAAERGLASVVPA